MRLDDYNFAVQRAATLERLEAEAPQLLPLYGVLARHRDFASSDQPTHDMRRFLLEQGLPPRVWRLALRGGGALLAPIARFYCGDTASAALAHLRWLDAVGFQRPPPRWVVEQWLSLWGNAGHRAPTYLDCVSDAETMLNRSPKRGRHEARWSVIHGRPVRSLATNRQPAVGG